MEKAADFLNDYDVGSLVLWNTFTFATSDVEVYIIIIVIL